MIHSEYKHGGDIFGMARKKGVKVEEIQDFSANINPLGAPQTAIKAIIESVNLVRHYPDPRCTDLRRALSAHLGVPPENMLPGNGASELIYLLARLMGRCRVVVPKPTFIEYAKAVTAAGGSVLEVPLEEKENFALSAARVVKKLEKADVLFVCNPNNPTSRVERRIVIQSLVEEAGREGKLIVVDEAFMDFVTRADQCTVMPLVERHANLVVLYSLTKFFGIPGLRLGVLVGPVSLIKELEALKDPWSVNMLAQVAGTAALADRDYMEETMRVVEREREFLYRAISLIPGLVAFHPDANYLLVKIKNENITSTRLASETAKRGVLVRDCSTFSGLNDRYIRVAVKTRKENIVLLQTLRSIMEGV